MICHIRCTCIYAKINVQKDPSNQQWLEDMHQQCVEIEAYKIFFLHIARKTQNKRGGGCQIILTDGSRDHFPGSEEPYC